MYFITTKRMLEVCFSVHPNIQYRTDKYYTGNKVEGAKPYCWYKVFLV